MLLRPSAFTKIGMLKTPNRSGLFTLASGFAEPPKIYFDFA
jgi:hypothetical protein